MYVGPSEISEVLKLLYQADIISLDTETNGLRPWQGDRLFSIICSTEHETYYFDFATLNKACIKEWFEPIFAQKLKRIHMMNAKFDMAMLYQEGVHNVCTPIVIDAQVTARLLHNDLMRVSMEALAPWVGMEKDKKLEKWAMANNAWVWKIETNEEGEETRYKEIRYDMIPLEIIQPYAENDARITYKLGEFILQEIHKRDEARPATQPSILRVLKTEISTTKLLFDMEREGVVVNKAYIQEAMTYEVSKYKECAREFELATGSKFKSSGKVLGAAFEKYSPEDKPKFKYTPTGQFCTQDAVLSSFTSPLAKLVQDYRDSYKRAGTYFANYLDLVDDTGRIHASFNQVVRTGRLSCRAPNLQNVSKNADKKSSKPIRRCFVPEPETLLGSIDFNSMEYRVMLDHSGELALIEKVLGGLDVHNATAEMMGVDRNAAKTINFMLLYGGGDAKLAEALKIGIQEARQLKLLYFSRLPKVAALIQQIIKAAETRKQVFNWCGRVYQFPDPRFAYKAPNYIVQGGCADVMKQAMIDVREYLVETKARTKLVMSVHDELVFYVHKNEVEVLDECRKIMEQVYPYRHLPLTASSSISEISWADME